MDRFCVSVAIVSYLFEPFPRTLFFPQGAEPENVPSLTGALAAGKPVLVPSEPTLADGLLVPQVGTNAFALARKHVDR